MQTTTKHNRLDSLLRRVKHRAAVELVLPGLAIVGIAMAAAAIAGA